MAKKKSEENEGRKPDGKFAEGNTISVGNNGGRPALFTNPEDFEQKTLEYFDFIKGEYEIKEGSRTFESGRGDDYKKTTETYEYKFWIREPETPSVTGLAIYLGFESRQSMYDYLAKPEYSYFIKKALLHVENTYERGLWNDKVVGPIFGLKNMGWTDKSETKLTGDPDNPIEVKEQTKIIFTRGFGDSK
ncbi:terminase small subunit [Chryseobacterium sediminis]|nr:terminase small subunit [Chryseobacterium sediminis]